MRRLEEEAPAKVNLFLEVLGRRPDGYHELATLLVAVSLLDSLELREAPPEAGVRLECDHPGLSTGPDNLVVRAAHLIPTRSIEATIAELAAEFGPAASLCILPQGPLTVPYVAAPALV